MALNSNALSDELTNLIMSVAALNPDGSPKPASIKPHGDFAKGFALAYNRYAKDGEVLGAENSGGDSSHIESVLHKVRVSEEPVDIEEFALAFAEFWDTVAIDPADPGHGGNSVSTVENNALAHVGDFKAAISASITTEEKRPWYLHFIQNLENMAVKKITWTVTEVFSSGPSSFEENIT